MKTKINSFFSRKKGFLFGVGIFIFLTAFALFARAWFVVAIVNNVPILRPTFDKELEKQIGKQVLDNKITEILILQEAQKQKVNISPSEIDARVKDIEAQLNAQGQNLDSILALQGLNREELKKQIKTQLTVEKIAGKDIQISDGDVSNYFEANKQAYPKGTTLESKKEAIRNELFQNKLAEKFQAWVTNLKQQAKIYDFLTP